MNSIKKILNLMIFLFSLFFLLLLPKYISIGSTTLLDWQRETLGWNYIGVFANYLLFVIYWKCSGKSLSYFGVHLGKWRKELIWYSILTIIVLLSIRFIDGSFSFQSPTFSTILFQFIFVALGEELFFRGYIQSEYGFWVASLGFGFIHFLNILVVDITWVQALLWLVQATGLGIIMGIIRKKTDSIFASALFHGLINLFNHIF